MRQAMRRRAWGPPVIGTPRSRISPRQGARMPASASSSSDWPLPATPAMPTISPARTSKLMPFTRGTPWSPMTSRSRTSSTGSRGRAGPFSTRSSTLRPTISSASSSSKVSAVRGARPCARAHDADLVGHRHDLAQLVGDQDDGAPLRLEVAQDAEQMVGLLRRQHAGGLVQDQDMGAAEQSLEDLDPLLHAHRQLARPGRRGRPPARSRAPAPGPRPGRGRRRASSVTPPSAPSSRFSRTVNGSTSMKCWWTMPMPALIASCGPRMRPLAARRPGSGRGRAGRSRRGCSSASTCRRRSRR